MDIFRETLIDPIFDVESIGDGPRVPRAHLEVVLTQPLAATARALYFVCVTVYCENGAWRLVAARLLSPNRYCLLTS